MKYIKKASSFSWDVGSRKNSLIKKKCNRKKNIQTFVVVSRSDGEINN